MRNAVEEDGGELFVGNEWLLLAFEFRPCSKYNHGLCFTLADRSRCESRKWKLGLHCRLLAEAVSHILLESASILDFVLSHEFSTLTIECFRIKAKDPHLNSAFSFIGRFGVSEVKDLATLAFEEELSVSAVIRAGVVDERSRDLEFPNALKRAVLAQFPQFNECDIGFVIC